MNCRQCGTEIADKALVCFRCGAPTSTPEARVPAPGRARSRRLAWLLVAVVLLIVEYVLIQIRGVRVPGAVLLTILVLAGLCVALAVRPRR